MDKTEYLYDAYITRVVDGDTVDALIDLGFSVKIKSRLRLNNLDTPEIRTRDKEEKERGLLAKAKLVELVQDKEVLVKTYKTGKYGRMLADIFLDDVNINEVMKAYE